MGWLLWLEMSPISTGPNEAGFFFPLRLQPQRLEKNLVHPEYLIFAGCMRVIHSGLRVNRVGWEDPEEGRIIERDQDMSRMRINVWKQAHEVHGSRG